MRSRPGSREGCFEHFLKHLDALLPSVALERMTIGRLMPAPVVAAAAVVLQYQYRNRHQLDREHKPRDARAGQRISRRHARSEKAVQDMRRPLLRYPNMGS
jgi:hypothetical protein